MDRNFLIAIALSLAVLTFWMSWQADRRREWEEAQKAAGETAELQQEAPATPGPTPERVPSPSIPTASAVGEARLPGTAAPETAPPPEASSAEERRVVVETPLFEATLSTRGGTLTRFTLADYFDASQPGKPRIELTTAEPGGTPALATPFDELGLGDLRQADFQVERPDPLTVVFSLERQGVRITKTYRFQVDSYAFRLGLEVRNGGSETVAPAFGLVWPAQVHPDWPDFREYSLVALNEGSLERQPVGSSGGGFLGFGGGDGGPQTFQGDLEWAGADTRYFLQAMIPDVPRDAVGGFVPVVPDRSAWATLSFRTHPVPPGQRAEREVRVYLGPKVDEQLGSVGAHLGRAVDLGWSWVAPLTRFFHWLLKLFHGVIPNYGIAIILVTILMRVVTAPLTAKQMRSMRKLGELQPKMKEIQAKHADDRQKQSEEMMKLYRTAGVNPLGGCLPMVLQMPAFIGLFYALQSSIDLRQEPFFGWIRDLAQPEVLFTLPGLDLPVRLLPVLMGASMILQQKMTPSTMDPAQARMMMTVMPVMFTVLFYQFPSGLVLYWLVSNLLGIGHQLWMNRDRKAKDA